MGYQGAQGPTKGPCKDCDHRLDDSDDPVEWSCKKHPIDPARPRGWRQWLAHVLLLRFLHRPMLRDPLTGELYMPTQYDACAIVNQRGKCKQFRERLTYTPITLRLPESILAAPSVLKWKQEGPRTPGDPIARFDACDHTLWTSEELQAMEPDTCGDPLEVIRL